MNARIAQYIAIVPPPQPNAENIHESTLYGPLFDTPVPDAVEGFEMEDTDKRKMEDVWPAGTEAAKDVGVFLSI